MSTRTRGITLTIADDAWEPVDAEDTSAGLLGPTLWINGVGHHLHAVPVTDVEHDESGTVQAGVTESADETYQKVAALDDRESFQTLTIAGALYVCYLTPFAR